MFQRKNPGQPGWLLLVFAAILLLLLAAAQGYVSWQAQYIFIFAAKHTMRASVLEALGLDTAAIIFAILGLAHARMGRSAVIERTLNLACVGGSMVMNLLGANLGSPRSVAVYVLPAVLYAACSDRLIATVGHMSGVRETSSMWRVPGMTFLYLLRLPAAPWSTLKGFRWKLLELTPLPETRTSGTHPDALPGTAEVVPETTSGFRPVAAEPVTPERTRRAASRPSRAATLRRELPEVLAEAEQKFGPAVSAGTVPGVREIRSELGVGQARAGTVQEHLAALMAEADSADAALPDSAPPPGNSLPDDYDTETFRTVGHMGAGQQPQAFSQLPYTAETR